jgi:hypothetical protein
MQWQVDIHCNTLNGNKMMKSIFNTLGLLAGVASLFLAVHLFIGNPPTVKQPVELTTVYPTETYPVTTVTADSQVADAGPEKVRPTAQQLSEKFLIWELRDLVNQAVTPEDKKLVQEALDLRLQRIKVLELSSDFETNMQRGLK